MAQTTIIISNLDKSNFVASGGENLSLASQIKATLLDKALYTEHTDKILSHWSELPFLNRIIAIFETESAATRAHEYLLKSHANSLAETAFRLPDLARISLQENLLQRSKLSEELKEENAIKPEKPREAEKAKNSGDLAGYNEPEPKPIDMYEDLLHAGIDILKFNTEEQVNEVKTDSINLAPAGLGRARSLTKTLFKPSLLIDTRTAHSGAPPLSPTITLDQS